ncbi:MAG: hypothetical protein V3V14_11700 [Saprospiraceae bacterium]
MLNNWLSPVSSDTLSTYFDSSYEKINNFPNLRDIRVVFFSKQEKSVNSVRNALSKLYNNFSVPIIDIGNLNKENPSFIYQVISELQDGNILPILVDVSKQDFIELAKAMVAEEKLKKATFVSNCISPLSNNYSTNNIGYQRHFNPAHLLQDVLNSDSAGLSLGELRSKQHVVEPILRETNYLHFDISAIRKSECPSISNSLPTGLYTEEACQIMRYAGEGSRLKLVTFDTHNLDANNEIESMIVAELIWYLQEGLDLNIQQHPSITTNFKEYIIELNELNHSLKFFQSTSNGKWWLKTENSSNIYTACSFEEYQATINNELPARLLKLI